MHVKHESSIYTKLLSYVNEHIFAIRPLKSKVEEFLICFCVKTILSFKDTEEWKGNNISLHLIV